MSKNPREELDEVFIKSQRLAHFADAGSSARYMNRNVAELNEATKLMAEKIESSNSRSLRTLATEDLSAKNLLSQVNSIRLKSKGEPARLETTSMEGYLAHHREMIVLTAIEESRRRSDEYLEASRRRWNAREWEAAKASFMESLGHRAQSWGKTTSQQAASSSSVASSSSSAAAAASSSRGLPRTISSQVPPVFVEHRNAIRAINVADHSEQRRPIAACSLLLEKASLLVAEDGFMTENDIAGYTLTLEMLRAMVGEGPASNAAPCVPGKFAAVCFDAHVVEEDHQHALRRLLRRGGQRFLEDQALAQWTSVVSGHSSTSSSLSAASLLGHSYGGGGSGGEARSPGGTKQAQVRSYVAFLAATNALPAASLSSASAASAMSRGGSFGGSGSFSLSSPLSVGGRSASSGGTGAGGAAAALPLWPFVYHCLRSGQLSLAIDELREHHAHKAHAQHALVDQVLAVLQIVASVAHVFDATDADDAANAAVHANASGLRGGRPRMAREVSTMMDGRELKTTLLNLQEQYRLRLHAAMTHATTTPFGAASGGSVAVSASEAAAASSSGAAGAVDVYLLTVLNLVSGANRTAFTECHRSVSWLPPSCDLFDMLWASLWFIGLDAAVQTQFPPGLFAADLVGGGHRRSLVLDTATTATATSSSSNALATSAFGGTGTGDVNTQQGEAEFLDLVYGLAAEHFFDRPELRATAPTTRHNLSATFRFVLALVACHRFGDAIHHLWLQGQVFAAVHLACLGLHYGWLLPHQPLLANPSRPRVQHAYATHVASVTQLTPLTIVQLFVRHPLLAADVALVSDYLVTLPLAAETLWQQTRHRDVATRDVAKSQAQEATAELLDAFVMSLADVDSVVALVGGRVPSTAAAAGAAAGAAMPTVRQGYLRQYFSERQLHAMVVRIADRFRRQRDARRAIDFYRVAGHVKDAVVEFCGLLALHWAKVDETYASHFHAAAAAAAAAAATASNAASNGAAAATALSVRSFWRQAATAFAIDVDRDAAAWTALDQEAREYVDFLKQLLRLYDAVDALLLQQAPLEALRLVDSLQLVPCPDAPATSATPPRLVAATVLDDVVLFVAQCVVSAYQHWQRHVHVRALGIVAVHPSSSGAAEAAGGVETLKLRWKLLMDFARDVKRLLRNPQTVLDLVQLDTSFKW
eukprot:gene1610-1172_t